MSHHYIKFDNVHFSYSNGYEALKGISFLITHGEKVALLGLNGAGKSTVLLHTNGLLLPTSGEVNIGGIPVTKKTASAVRRAVGMLFQNPDDQLFMPTVEEDVAFGPVNMKLPEDEVERRVVMALEAVGATSLRKRASYQLSGGQKRSVAIATVLSMEPDILVLDEPSSNLDPHSRRLMMEQLRRFKHTCIVTTHDIDMVKELCARTIVMAEGRIIADGATEDVFRDEEVLCQGGLV